MTRKQFLKWAGISSAGLLAGAGVSLKDSNGKNLIISLCTSRDLEKEKNLHYGALREAPRNAYGSMTHPPDGISSDYLDRFFFPMQSEKKYPEKTIDLIVQDMNLPIAHKTSVDSWTFNGQAPGPILRFREGEEFTVRFRNFGQDPHSLHFHGTHDPNQDGWEPIPSGKETEYKLQAKPFGIHPYHCHVPPIGTHIAKGLYGAMIVDPQVGRKPAHEVVLILSGWDLQNEKKNQLYTWNGIANFYERYPIKVPVGELVRVYLFNMLEYESLFTFHLHSQSFQVYRSGSKLTPDELTDVVTLYTMERAILEFTFTKRGRYMFHPHQSHMAENGAMGWFVAI